VVLASAFAAGGTPPVAAFDEHALIAHVVHPALGEAHDYSGFAGADLVFQDDRLSGLRMYSPFGPGTRNQGVVYLGVGASECGFWISVFGSRRAEGGVFIGKAKG
jgi:hypothetical protein